MFNKWLVVDERGGEYLFDGEFPERHKGSIKGNGMWLSNKSRNYALPKGSIEHLIGKKLTWEDEPFEIDIKLKNK